LYSSTIFSLEIHLHLHLHSSPTLQPHQSAACCHSNSLLHLERWTKLP
jgi:hypothetical protein